MLTEQLQNLGLGKNEAAVYVALFDLGKCKAGEIIEHTSLHRNLVYTALEKLTKEKLVVKYTKNNVAVYQANNPNALLTRLHQQQQTARELVKALHAKSIAAPHEIKIYEGLDGIIEARKVSLDLKKQDVIYAFGGSDIMYSHQVSEQWRPFHNKRVQKGVNLKMLCDVTVPQTYINRKNSQPHTVAKRLPINAPLPALFEVYGDTLNIAVPGKTPVVFSLKSREAAQAMKNFFEYFWKQ